MKCRVAFVPNTQAHEAILTGDILTAPCIGRSRRRILTSLHCQGIILIAFEVLYSWFAGSGDFGDCRFRKQWGLAEGVRFEFLPRERVLFGAETSRRA